MCLGRPIFATTTDMWTSGSNDAYITLTIVWQSRKAWTMTELKRPLVGVTHWWGCFVEAAKKARPQAEAERVWIVSA